MDSYCVTKASSVRQLAVEYRPDEGAMTHVTVAIPTRERWAFARRALASVLEQTGVAFDVIVVDDGSRDAAGDVADFDDPRVRVLTLPRAGGVAAARNAAIAEARGEWVSFLDDDDVWAPDKLARQLQTAAAHDADFVWTGQLLVDRDMTPLKAWAAPAADGIARALLDTNGIGGPSSMMVRRSALTEVGGFDERLSVLADWDLWLRLAANHTPAACPDLVTAYTLHDSNMHIVAMDRAIEEHAYMRDKHAALTDAAGVELGGRRFWEWVALGYRLQGRRLAAAATYLKAWRASGCRRDLVRAAVVLAGEPVMRLGAAKRPPIPSERYEWLRQTPS